MDKRIDKIQGEITALKSLLEDTDYALFRVVEDMTDCSTLLELINVFSEFLKNYRDVVAKRREWREKINGLETELETLMNTETVI